MFKLANFPRRIAAALVVTQLSLAGFGLAAIVAPAPAAAVELVGEHGAWQGVTMTVEGREVFGVKTIMQDGGVAAILVDQGKISLVLIDEGWRLQTGLETDIGIVVDGHAFTGTGISADATTIIAKDIDPKFVRALIAGDTASVNIGGVKWTLSLIGFTGSMSDALRAAGASS